MAVEPLTAADLDDYRAAVHSYDSFGRSVVELMLREARRMMLAEETESAPVAVEFKADVIVSSIGPAGHAAVELCVPSIGCSKIHVAID